MISGGWKTFGLAMAMEIAMDHTGDTKHQFDADDIKGLAVAQGRLKELTFVGTAAVHASSGETKVARTFDQTAEETQFYPRLVGG
jgi:hypothetical protein